MGYPSPSGSASASPGSTGSRPWATSHASGRPSPSVSAENGLVPAAHSSPSESPSPSASPVPSTSVPPKFATSHSSGMESPSEDSPAGRVVETTMSSTEDPTPVTPNSAGRGGASAPMAMPTATTMPSTYRSQVREA